MMPQSVRDLQQHFDNVTATTTATKAKPTAPIVSTAIQNAAIAEAMQGNELNPFALPLDFMVHKKE